MSGKHRRYVFLRILLDGSRLVPPAVPTRCGENGGPRIGGYLTAVMRRYLPSSPTVGRRPSPWSSTVSRSASPGSCSRSAPRCAARCRGPRPRFAPAGRTRASSRARPGPKVCVRRSTLTGRPYSEAWAAQRASAMRSPVGAPHLPRAEAVEGRLVLLLERELQDALGAVHRGPDGLDRAVDGAATCRFNRSAS